MMETVHVKCNNTNHENNPLVHPRRQAQAEHPPARPYQGWISHCCEFLMIGITYGSANFKV